jgi:tetratricopeptide (TPR) repeat protein
MKKFTISTKLLVATLLITLNATLFAQLNTQINYKVKGNSTYSAIIYFSDENGAEYLSPDEFIGYQNAFFTIKPVNGDVRGFFKEKDITDDLSLITLFQDGKEISNAAPLRQIENEAGKVDRVVMAFGKRNVFLYKPFEFRGQIDTASPVLLSDKYFKYYFQYEPIYIEGLNFSDKRDYLAAFNTFMNIVDDAQTNQEIKKYSFWESASEIYIQTAIEQHADSLSNTLERLSTRFSVEFSKSNLRQQDSVLSLIIDAKKTFGPYMEMDFPKSSHYASLFTGLIAEAELLVAENYKRFNRHEMQFLETYDFNNYEFSFYIDLIARMLCDLDTLKLLDGLAPVEISVLDGMPGKKQELINAEWLSKFRIIVNVINSNIRNRGFVLGDSVMGNLQLHVPQQHQPYHEIFIAFNYLNENAPMFKSFLSEAIRKCTDSDLIEDMEMWILSYNLTYNEMNSKVVSHINEGIYFIYTGNWVDAANIFNILTKQANTVAPPWFYSGVVKFENGGQYSAESMFSRALERYPKYIAPRVFNFEILFEQENFDGLLTEVNDAIAAYDIWLFHFWKARALFALAKYRDAVSEIEDECNSINPWAVQAYFLLGDSYKELHNFDKAEQAYRKTQMIDPYMDSGIFDEKMTTLLELGKK